jgi:transcriptional regulator with XRE-family HTH domain
MPPAGNPAPTAGDAQIAAIFRQMRAILGLSVPGLARRLGTDIAVIMELETGGVDNLPPWPETVRIIEGYGAMTGVDQGPLLSRILMLQTPTATRGAGQVSGPPQSTPVTVIHEATPVTRPHPYPERRQSSYAVPAPRTPAQVAYAEAEIEDVPAAAPPPARRQRWRAFLPSPRIAIWLGVPIAAVFCVALVAKMAPQVLYSAVEAMPFAIRAPLRPSVDHLVTSTAPVRDGLRWIDSVNPRSRKSDRLPSTLR